MALKDWKKIAERENGIFYENKKTLQKLVIISTINGKIKGFAVTTEGEIINNSNSKSQAIKFAKEYMRKN